jgi:hypothetical protein
MNIMDGDKWYELEYNPPGTTDWIPEPPPELQTRFKSMALIHLEQMRASAGRRTAYRLVKKTRTITTEVLDD